MRIWPSTREGATTACCGSSRRPLPRDTFVCSCEPLVRWPCRGASSWLWLCRSLLPDVPAGHGGGDRRSWEPPGPEDRGGFRYLQRGRFSLGHCLLAGRRRCSWLRDHPLWRQGRRVAKPGGLGELRRAPGLRDRCGRLSLALRCRSGDRHPASSVVAGGGRRGLSVPRHRSSLPRAS